MIADCYDETGCALGEGPLWHPERNQLFWFDILNSRLHTREGHAARQWQFEEMVSAAGWVDETNLLIASETRLFLFNVTDGSIRDLAPLEADNPATRSNDGRADPWGGFWIGTMGKAAEPGMGAIYRYYRGTVTRLFDGITIPNSIAFAPNRSVAYFADTVTGQIRRQKLEPTEGWPDGPSELWLDLRADGLNPDGSVCDAEGRLWNAQWGASRVACYEPDGTCAQVVTVPANHTSCPAFGGPDFETLFVTTAQQGIDALRLETETAHGCTFAANGVGPGLSEYRVIL